MAGKMRVTIIALNYSPEPTGNAPYVTGLAQRLQERGHAVTVITGYPHYPEWKIRDGYTGWRRRELIDGVRVERLRHYVPSVPAHVPRAMMEVTFGLRVILTRWHRPDAVLFVNPALFATVLGMVRSKFGRRVPSAVWVHDLYGRGLKETSSAAGLTVRLMARVESSLLRSAGAVVAIHGSFRQYIVDSLGIEPAKVAVVRNWTHLAAAPDTDRAALRRKLGWQPDETIVLHAGNMGVKQGLENVVEAARIAAARKSKLRFVLLGQGSQRARLEALGDGIPNLSFLAPVSDAQFQPVLAAADLLLVNELPGVQGMSVPSKLTSYFSTGRPVIAATGAGSATASEIAASGGGVQVPAGDPQALVTAAEELGKDLGRSRQLGEAGLRFRRRELMEMHAISAFEELLDQLAGNPDSFQASFDAAEPGLLVREESHASH